MKRNLFWAFLALLLVYLLPLALPSPPSAMAQAPAPSASPAPSPSPAAATAAEPAAPRELRLLLGDRVLSLSEEDYLVGVVAAEMPASFPEEALKAQAVAARSYARYCAATGKHPEADLCADPGIPAF